MRHRIPNTFNAATPVGQAFSNAVNTYQNNLPTQLERLKAQRLQQEIGSSSELENTLREAFKPTTPLDPNVPLTREQMVQAQLPAIAGTLGRAGEIDQIGNLFRAVIANAPGLQDTQLIDRAKLGAGDSFASTIGGFREGEQGKFDRTAYTVNNRPISVGNKSRLVTPQGQVLLSGGGGAGSIGFDNIAPGDSVEGGPPVSAEPQSADLFDLANDTAGVRSSLAEMFSRTVGQLPGVPLPQDTLRARQAMTIAQNGLIRALSLNPKLPVAEIKRIKEELSIQPDAFDSPGALRARMQSLDKALESMAANILSRPQDSDDHNTLTAIQDFRRDLNVPRVATPGRGGPVNFTRDGEDAPTGRQAPTGGARPSLNDIFGG